MSSEIQPEIQRFQDFLRIPTVSGEGPKGAYQRAVQFLRNIFDSHQISHQTWEGVPGKPLLIASIPGEEKDFESVLFNCHYDVVPVDLSGWHYDPFAATINDQQEVVARGAQDMKCVCMQYVEAILRLVGAGKKFKRTIHLTFVPDEEVGGIDGLGLFVKSPEFQQLRVAMALDEGLASESNEYTVFYGERGIWWLIVRATGPTGHASRLPEATAMQRLITSINRFLEYRQGQLEQLHGHHGAGCSHAVAKTLGDVVSINLTMLQGGVTTDGKRFALNVIPSEAQAGFDLRIPPHIDPRDFEQNCIREFTNVEGVSYEFVIKNDPTWTDLDPAQNRFWAAFQHTMSQLGCEYRNEIFPASTDSKFLRQINIPAIGFSPMKNTKILLHDHDERLAISTYLEGIDVYVTLMENLANA
eukprot:TRINITY_DN2772_c0_g1_i2.p1 TRINITY_DN2772_c0_g1~~TRINITY_DN2772_c0_g1_i2.p1  ORF type:complete len:434 (+),score=117.65 TRINITY_DN2772_c0_g1_i2:60-1304(+)